MPTARALSPLAAASSLHAWGASAAFFKPFTMGSGTPASSSGVKTSVVVSSLIAVMNLVDSAVSSFLSATTSLNCSSGRPCPSRSYSATLSASQYWRCAAREAASGPAGTGPCGTALNTLYTSRFDEKRSIDSFCNRTRASVAASRSALSTATFLTTAMTLTRALNSAAARSTRRARAKGASAPSRAFPASTMASTSDLAAADAPSASDLSSSTDLGKRDRTLSSVAIAGTRRIDCMCWSLTVGVQDTQ
mmetsp:Transcript_3145/g.9801  ORF Transcript_3145/g.9801 Transcript_3145/m.9801 type:complete len:249 (+) Transcript_3145:18-764(+)